MNYLTLADDVRLMRDGIASLEARIAEMQTACAVAAKYSELVTARAEAAEQENEDCADDVRHQVTRAQESEARCEALESALREIGEMAGPGLAGTGEAGWLLTLRAPEIARSALATSEQAATTGEAAQAREGSVI